MRVQAVSQQSHPQTAVKGAKPPSTSITFSCCRPIAGQLGTLTMGGCMLTCLLGQQQTTAPAVITGAVTSNPKSVMGTISAEYALGTVDGSGEIWNVVLPVPSQLDSSFTTSSNGCASPQNPFCAPYALTLPSQKPLQFSGGQYTQFSGFPVYDVEASLTGSTGCIPSTVAIYAQANGSPLTATPGVSLSARDITFVQCQ